MKSYESRSAVRPPVWDAESSKVVVYHNINVQEIPATEEDPVMYAYDVEEYTRDEYYEIAAPRRLSELEEAIDAIEYGIINA